MPWLVDDVLLIEIRQDYLEQSMTNTLFYKIIDIVGTAITSALIELFVQAIVDFLKEAQIQEVDHVEQITSNLTDGLSQQITTYATTGTLAIAMPTASFLAVGMKKAVGSRITRPGSIRISGFNEGSIAGNDIEPAYVSILEAVGDTLAATVIINDQAGSVATFNPVVVGRNVDGSFDVARINDILDVGLPRLTTQNSRKPDR